MPHIPPTGQLVPWCTRCGRRLANLPGDLCPSCEHHIADHLDDELARLVEGRTDA